MVTMMALPLWLLVMASAIDSVAASRSSSNSTCSDDCVSISCLPEWWKQTNALMLSGAAVLVFFATFLPRVLVRLVIGVLVQIPFIKKTAEDFRLYCSSSSAYLISVSLVWLALEVAKLGKFFCHIPKYFWGLFFIVWLYSLFNVVESLAIRRIVGVNEDPSKKVMISESIKLHMRQILRLTVLLIISLAIYSSILGDRATLKNSVLVVIGLAIALGFVPSFHNVVGGLFLAFNSQFKIDDFIQVGTAQGFVHRVSLRYTTMVTMEGTKAYVPNSFFLFKPMINFTQRPKRDVDIRITVASTTSVERLRECMQRLEEMLQSLHVGLTSHEDSKSDLRHGEKWDRFCFVAMEELYQIRVYSYTEEIDARKHAMIKSEVWLAVMEIMEDMSIEVIDEEPVATNKRLDSSSNHRDQHPSPFTREMSVIVGAESAGARTML
ncbi:TPA: hypothetical protein N0F65_004561 [Lagenidium giganteum]|uniref:Mechanosensitive ion channel MscS domain-containing protein n=1 Tax=Lagenidium giganteum TaxID=4803 RepID=A0AAV2ZC27_9STRA|nr:TPA: hypothetical protein N0F65_004561 [Lagenidium giganteum]